MKRRTLQIVLCAEAVVLLLVVLLGWGAGEWPAGSLAVPFAQIGAGLRALSLSGGAGNGIAIVLYVLLCLVPVGVLVWLSRRRPLAAEDSLLVVLSLFLFVALYFMVNPGKIPGLMVGTGETAEAQLAVGQSLFGGTVYAILLAYLVLRLLRRFQGADRQKLQDDLAVLLSGLAVCLVFVIFGAGFAGFWGECSALLQTGEGPVFGVTTASLAVERDGLLVLAFLRWVGEMLPYLLDVVVILAVLDLLGAMKRDRYSEETLDRARWVSRLCTGSLAASLVTTVVLNLGQLLFLGGLTRVSIQVVFPITAVAFLLGVLLVVKFLEENRALKEDNDLFI